MRETSLDYKNPYRPLPIRIVNAIGEFLMPVGIKADLSAAGLMKSAMRKTGLSDFGNPRLADRLAVLSTALEEEANLNFLGRYMVRETLLGMLTNRLRIEDDFKRHPEINDIEIDDPVIIAGLQRTGTTMLQRLISSDHEIFRHLASWEAINPALRPDLKKREGRDARIDTAYFSAKALQYIAPDFFAVHPIDAEGPEEDCLLMNYDLLSVVPEATQRVPSFSRWLDGQDHAEAYRFHKRLLKYLTWQKGPSRWVLKTPDHLLHLDALLAVYPGAKVIWTHRHPAETTASFCSMMAHAYGVFSDTIDTAEIGAHWSGKDALMVTKGMEARDRYHDVFYDVYYYDLVADPLGEIEKIYRFLNLELTGTARQRMMEWNEVNTQHRFGRHRYYLEAFGLDHDDIDRLFGGYIERFDLTKRGLAAAAKTGRS